MRSLSFWGSVHLRLIQIKFPICATVRLFSKMLWIDSKSRGKGTLSFGRILVRQTPTFTLRRPQQITMSYPWGGTLCYQVHHDRQLRIVTHPLHSLSLVGTYQDSERGTGRDSGPSRYFSQRISHFARMLAGWGRGGQQQREYVMIRLTLATLALVTTFNAAQAQWPQPNQQQPTTLMPSRQELYNSMVPQSRPGDGQRPTQTVCERAPTGVVVCSTR